MFFAFLTSPFPSHLGQIALVIAELARRGHRVEIWGDESLRETASRLGSGFQFVPSPPDLATHQGGFGGHPRDYYAAIAFPLVARQLPSVLRLCERHAPDVLHTNSRIYTAALASRLTGIPCSNHCCSGLSFGLIPEDLFGFRLTGNEPQRKRDLMIAMNRRFHQEIDILFDQTVAKPMGLDPVDNVLGLVSSQCVLTLSCPELANPRLAALPQTVFSGPLIAETEPPLPREDDYCYVSLGTWPLDPKVTIDLYRMLIAAVPQPYQVVVGLGGRFEPSRLGLKDKRVTVLEYAPQTRLVSTAAATICHGGCQTVHEALYFGKPLVILPPSLAEPEELAHRIAGAGAGLVLDYRRADSECVRNAVSAVLSDDSFRHHSEELGQLLRSAGGLAKAVATLERLSTVPAQPSPEVDTK